MKRILLISSFFLLGNSLFCQNLIPNADFENNTLNGKFKLRRTIDFLNAWSKISPHYIYHTYLPVNSTYIDTRLDSTYEIKNNEITEYFDSYYDIYPQSGSCYIRTNYTGNRNLFQAKLNTKLIKDSSYYFEIWYKATAIEEWKLEIKESTILGAYFTSVDYTDSLHYGMLYENEPFMFQSKHKLKLQPHINIKIDKNCVNKWTKYSEIIKIKTNYTHIIIGNFEGVKIKSQSDLNFYFDNLKLIPYEQAFDVNNLNKGDKLKLENVLFESNKTVLVKD